MNHMDMDLMATAAMIATITVLEAMAEAVIAGAGNHPIFFKKSISL